MIRPDLAQRVQAWLSHFEDDESQGELAMANSLLTETLEALKAAESRAARLEGALKELRDDLACGSWSERQRGLAGDQTTCDLIAEAIDRALAAPPEQP